MGPPEGNRLRQLEADIFRSKKSEIVKDFNKRKWDGSVQMNRAADILVSDVVKNALIEYE